MSPARDEPIHTFARVARDFCVLVGQGDFGRREKMLELQKALAVLDRAAVELGPLQVDHTESQDDIDDPDILPVQPTDVELSAHVRRYRAITSQLNLPFDLYWTTFNPLTDSEVIRGSLRNDLAEMVLDLEEGLAAYDLSNMSDAEWEWQFGFDYHWGAHLLGARRAVYWYLRESSDEDEG